MMYQKINSFVLMVFACTALQAQKGKTEDFTIAAPTFTTQSNFGYLEFMDVRKDTTSFGIVQKGAFNRKALVQPVIPIRQQFKTSFEALKSTSSVATDTLLLQVRDMKFAEVTEAFSETGYFYLRAVAYQKSNGSYYKTFAVDLIEEVSAMDVTQKNYKNASRILNDFISKAMSAAKDHEAQALSREEVGQIEAIEKKSYPLYTTAHYQDGLYTNYTNFRDQTPNNTDFKVEKNKKGKITSVTYKNFKDEYIPISKEDTYAVVVNGVPYISTVYGYYELYKKEDDFYYVGRTKVAADNGAVVAATVMFGIIGGLLASDNSDTYEIKIDHLNGTTILHQKIKN